MNHSEYPPKSKSTEKQQAESSSDFVDKIFAEKKIFLTGINPNVYAAAQEAAQKAIENEGNPEAAAREVIEKSITLSSAETADTGDDGSQIKEGPPIADPAEPEVPKDTPADFQENPEPTRAKPTENQPSTVEADKNGDGKLESPAGADGASPDQSAKKKASPETPTNPEKNPEIITLSAEQIEQLHTYVEALGQTAREQGFDLQGIRSFADIEDQINPALQIRAKYMFNKIQLVRRCVVLAEGGGLRKTDLEQVISGQSVSGGESGVDTTAVAGGTSVAEVVSGGVGESQAEGGVPTDVEVGGTPAEAENGADDREQSDPETGAESESGEPNPENIPGDNNPDQADPVVETSDATPPVIDAVSNPDTSTDAVVTHPQNIEALLELMKHRYQDADGNPTKMPWFFPNREQQGKEQQLFDALSIRDKNNEQLLDASNQAKELKGAYKKEITNIEKRVSEGKKTYHTLSAEDQKNIDALEKDLKYLKRAEHSLTNYRYHVEQASELAGKMKAERNRKKEGVFDHIGVPLRQGIRWLGMRKSKAVSNMDLARMVASGPGLRNATKRFTARARGVLRGTLGTVGILGLAALTLPLLVPTLLFRWGKAAKNDKTWDTLTGRLG